MQHVGPHPIRKSTRCFSASAAWTWLLACGLCFVGSGCQMFHWLHPHQMWKLNRQPAISRDDAYFSIPVEPIPEADESADATSAPPWIRRARPEVR